MQDVNRGNCVWGRGKSVSGHSVSSVPFSINLNLFVKNEALITKTITTIKELCTKVKMQSNVTPKYKGNQIILDNIIKTKMKGTLNLQA